MNPRLIVVTGGPGAGKTALIELVRLTLAPRVGVVREAAGILYGGGFPRSPERSIREAGQRAIFHVQRELERVALEDRESELFLCDRGTLDGLAYWPGEPDELMSQVGTTRAAELTRYHAIIHMRVPAVRAYPRNNPLRVESHDEAVAIDERIAAAWRGHPRVHLVEDSRDFMDKIRRALISLRDELEA